MAFSKNSENVSFLPLTSYLGAPVGYYLTIAGVMLSAILLGVALGKGLWIVCAGVVFVPLFLYFPIECTLGLYDALIPFDSIAVLGSGNEGATLTYFVGALSAVALLGVGIVAGRLHSVPKSSMGWILLTVWSALTAMWAIDSQATLKVLPTCAAMLGLYVMSSCFAYTRRELSVIVFSNIGGGCLCALWTVYLFYQGVFFEAGSNRASLVVGDRVANPDGIAMTLLIPIALALHGFFSSRQRIRKGAMLGAMALCGLALFLTMSRGAVVALAVMLLVYVFRMKLRAKLIAPFALIMLLLLILPSSFFARFSDATASGGAGRLDIWKAGLEAFKHYGLFGAGLANFPLAYYQYAGAAPHFRGLYRDPHNIYLSLAVETGVIGIALFALAVRSHLKFAAGMRKSLRDHGLLVAVEALAWGLLVFGLFGTILWEKAFWFAWMLVSAAALSGKNEPQSDFGDLKNPASRKMA